MAKTTKKQTKKTATKPTRDDLPKLVARYPHIQRIVATGTKGNATRVVIECTEADCNEEREIATQDAFQVHRCPACQREFAKARRRKTPVAPQPKPKSPKARTRKPKAKAKAKKAA